MSDQRFPTGVRFIGVMLKKASRVKMFMTSVLWSDQSEIIVYRSFQDFRKLHKTLKRKLAPENRFRTSDRILPRFRGRAIKKSFQRKGPTKSMLRLKFLEEYCTELLACDPSIAQCPEVIQFFLPQNQDLEPEYSKNSIVIIPSDDLSEGKERKAGFTDLKRLSDGNVTQPFVAETYRCVAPYETKDTKNRPFSVAVNETVEVLIKDKTGWWLVENEQQHLAWFPAPFLEKCEDEYDEDDDGDDEADCSLEGGIYCVVRSYRSTKEDELSVNIGSVVDVLEKNYTGWWLIRYNGKVGYVPSMYLQPYTNPHMRFRAVQKVMHQSTLCLAQLHFQEASSQVRPTQGGPLVPALRQRSRSMGVLLEPLPEMHRGSLSEGSEESSEFSFSDKLSSSESDSPNTGHSDAEEPAEVGEHADRKSSNGCTSSGAGSIPKVPPRPSSQEIFTRCTTITRKAARMYQANLFVEESPKQIH